MVLQGVRKVAANVVSLLASDISNRATTFVLYLLVARALTTFDFGQLSLGFSFFYVFQVFAIAGLKMLITREIARDRAQTERYLVTGSVVVALNSLLSFGVLLLTVWLLGYSRDTAVVILLLCVGLLPSSLIAICEAIFQGWEQMRYIAWANICVNVLRVALAFVLLTSGFGLVVLVGSLVACHFAVLAMEWFLIVARIVRPRLEFSRQFALEMLRTTLPFLGIDAMIAVSASLNLILLSKLASEVEVGLFSAAVQLLVPIALIFQNVAVSVFPLMCQRFDGAVHGLWQITVQLAEMLFSFAFPVAVGLWFLAEPALVLLYGQQDFAPASTVLHIVVWTVILTAFTSVFGQTILASYHEKTTLWIVAVNGAVGLILGFVLIGSYGITGAAITTLCIKLVDSILHYMVMRRLFGQIDLMRLVWKPALASGVMALYLQTAASQQHVLLSTALGGAIYLAVLFVVTIWSIGGPRKFKAVYQHLWFR